MADLTPEQEQRQVVCEETNSHVWKPLAYIDKPPHLKVPRSCVVCGALEYKIGYADA